VEKFTAKQKVHDPDCPESTPEALAEFAAMARELRKNNRNPSPVVALRVKPDTLSKASGAAVTR
jgi:hypothetical protein